MAALGAGFTPCGVEEHAPGAEFVTRYPRRYPGWPMLVVLVMRASGGDGEPDPG